MDSQAFLRILYGTQGTSGWLVLWGRSGQTHSFPVAELENAVAYTAQRSHVEDIYYAPGLQKSQPQGHARGEARTVSAIPGLWLDLDIAGGAHAKSAKELPTLDQAQLLLNQAPWSPTIKIQTGGGLHAYWLFPELWVLETDEDNLTAQNLSRRFQRYFIEAGRSMGFHVDNTSALNQVLRLPGTLNHKYDPAFIVATMEPNEGQRYMIEEIEDVLPVHETKSSPTNTVNEGHSGDHLLKNESATADLELIEQHCEFMAYCQRNAEVLTEPEWFAQATIISRCQDGEKFFHERSASYAKYNQPEAQAKLVQAQKYGPRTCASIRQDLGFIDCETCPLSGHVTSPISLGDPTPLAQAKIIIAHAVAQVESDPGAMFTESVLTALGTLEDQDKPRMIRLREQLKQKGLPLKKLEEAMKNKRREAQASGPLYRIEDNRFLMAKITLSGAVDVPLGNFYCVVDEEITRDDGAEQSKRFLLKGFYESGQPLPTIEIAASVFPSLNWVLEQYGSQAVINAGYKDHFRVAIQTCSSDVTHRSVYTHTGWRKIENEWAFMHGGGALGHNGPLENIEVDLNEAALKSYNLDPLTSRKKIREAISDSLKMLELAPKHISAPLLAGTYLAPLGQAIKITFSLFLAGLTGTRKSELAAIAQGHFGAEFSGKNLPANWSSTPNSLEKICFLAKNVLTVVDDFNPIGTQYDVSSYHKKADQLMRGQGNQAGRQRMRSDSSLRCTYYPRGLILGTGEDIPKGHSLRARMLVLELDPTDVNLEVLTELQRLRDNGTLCLTMTAYLQWLAPQIDDLTTSLPEYAKKLREEVLEAGKAHSRTPDIIACLLIGIETFLRFAVDHESIDQTQAAKLWEECRKAICDAAIRQEKIQQEECPVQRFMELLASAMSGGSAHLENIKGGVPCSHVEAYGWRKTMTVVNGSQVEDYRPQGKRIGWTDGSSVYLEPDVAFSAAQLLATSQGNSISIGMKTLQKRIANKNMIVSSDSGLNTKRIMISSTRYRVLHITCETLHPDISGE